MPLRRLSSDQVLNALIRMGCYLPRKARGSHQPVAREVPRGTLTAPVVLGRKEIAVPLLRAILQELQIDESEFMRHVR